MNRVEKDVVQRLLTAINNVYNPSSLESQIHAWSQLGHAMGAVTAALAYPTTEDEHHDTQFSTEFLLECWSERDQDWYGGCGWEQSNVKDAMTMLDWFEESRRRVVRYDHVTTTVILGERSPEPEPMRTDDHHEETETDVC